MKRMLAMLIAIVMVFSLMPVSAFAAELKGGKITFTTDFTNEMGVGDTFTVTATLTENPGIAGFTNTLQWNSDVVEFLGFMEEYSEDDEDYVTVTDVFSQSGWIFEPRADGLFTAARTNNKTKNGILYVAEFKITAEAGALNLGLKTTEHCEYFTFCDENLQDIDPEIDVTAISGLTVGGKAVGPEMPEDAPFTAITTDAGAILAVEYVEDLEFNGGYVPYYIVTIPADATTAYVTAPDQVVMEDWTTGAMQATGYAANLEDLSNPLYISYNYEETDDGIKVEIPMYMVASDWSGEVELDFIETHAFGIEDANYACLGLISFKYDDGAESYAINIDEIIEGGYVTAANENGNEITEAKEGETVYLNIVSEEGYKAMTWGYIYEGQTYHCENGVFDMPPGDVTLTATFQKEHTHSYTKEVVAEKYLKTAATCESGAVYYKSCECDVLDTNADTFVSGEPVAHKYEDGKCIWCGLEETQGYKFATSADVTAENGGTAVVHVKITGHTDSSITFYNAYDLTLTFDSSKLEFKGYDGAVKNDGGSVTVEGNTIRIVGCGENKNFGTEIAALTFQTKAEGAANVTISKVQVSDKNESIKADAPVAAPEHHEDDTTADETPDVSVIIVPYTVTKPGFVSGNTSVLPGASYTFSYTDTTNYTYSGLTVKVGGEEVTPAEENGVYTIANVNGAIEITATQTANSYDVTFNEDNTATVEGPEKATYGENYVFTVTPSEDYAIESVTVTDAEGNEIPYSINEKGEYVIGGTDISGAFTITVTETNTKTSVTFSGVTADEVEGGLNQTAEIGKVFTFKLNKEEEFDYIVKVGDNTLEEKDGQYTIPAELVVAEGVTVTITKVDNSIATVDVQKYIDLDGKVMFLITAKWGEKVLAYGENTMYWSEKYTVDGEAGAYCWLVVSSDSAENVKAAAEEAIQTAAEGATATKVDYDYDVNGTTKVDVNDAQLAYDMYNASYMEFTNDLPMLKFLEADIQTDMELNTQDVAAIINYLVSGVMAA